MIKSSGAGAGCGKLCTVGTRRGGGEGELVLDKSGIAKSNGLARRRVKEAVGGRVAIVADKDQRHGLVVELCTTVGDMW